jgi:hypothetical protein
MKGETRAARLVTSASSFSAPASAPFEKCGEGGQVQTVKHPLLRHAAFSRHFNAPVREINLISRVGIGIDAHEAAELERLLVPAPIEIKPPGIGIDLNRDAVLGAGAKNALCIELVARSTQQLPPRHMSKNCRVGIGNCTKDALGLLHAVELEPAMDARHNKIKLCQNLIWIIERAVSKNIRLDAFENAKR